MLPKKFIWLFVALALIALAIAILYLTKQKEAPISPSAPVSSKEPLSSFAKCLASNGVIMYGSETCPYCQAQKRAFLDSFEYVNYVDCGEDQDKCVSAKIERMPTWVFPSGLKLIGNQDIQKLSIESGCALDL